MGYTPSHQGCQCCVRRHWKAKRLPIPDRDRWQSSTNGQPQIQCAFTNAEASKEELRLNGWHWCHQEAKSSNKNYWHFHWHWCTFTTFTVGGVEASPGIGLIWTWSLEECVLVVSWHDMAVNRIIQRCWDSGLRLNPKKAKILSEEITYFWHDMTFDKDPRDKAVGSTKKRQHHG